MALASLGMGYLAVLHGVPIDTAKAHLEQSFTIYEELGDTWGCAASCFALGRIALLAGDIERARDCLDRTLDLSQQGGDRQGIAATLNALAMVARLEGDHTQAIALHRRSLPLYRAVDDRGNLAGSLEALAGALGVTGRPVRAARLFGAADALRREHGTPMLPGEAPAVEADIAHVRSLLGQEAFAAAWTEGQHLSIDGAITEAHQDRPVAPAPARRGAAHRVHGLSRREMEVLRLIAQGLSNQQIADRLNLSPRTVTSHASSILGKLGLSSRTAVVAYAIRHDLT
jgi:non-specific serine/threonine protein kinase